jgi:hypothetical protein
MAHTLGLVTSILLNLVVASATSDEQVLDLSSKAFNHSWVHQFSCDDVRSTGESNPGYRYCVPLWQPWEFRRLDLRHSTPERAGLII